MVEIAQELMTPQEAAEWFRRSPTWIREQRRLLRMKADGGQALYHVDICRAYVLGLLRELDGDALQRIQLAALEAACKLSPTDHGDLTAVDRDSQRR